MARVIILNGTSSAGKSSLARALQLVARRPLLHVQMDTFLGMQPPRMDNHPDAFVFRPVEGAEPPEIAIDCGPYGQRVLEGMRRSVAALAGAGLDLVVDDVWLGRNEQQAYTELLTGHDVAYVGVRASLAACEAREHARGDRDIGQTRWQHGRVHQGARYDLEVDTSDSPPETVARQIAEAFGL
ncbi:AAA family ATPase [Hyphomonas sp. WL0036]|uniref:chloramphenicol phosphotransferase CPT family protein n=1 Tax=Hyphomonas sediminis TaxID=2866160 RepID=UPI001C816BC2|nr:AAA family ATPase [Hyphomonas sediminis]MBY9065400.1 AAA family ATPase [Hyphomonas sediminis]